MGLLSSTETPLKHSRVTDTAQGGRRRLLTQLVASPQGEKKESVVFPLGGGGLGQGRANWKGDIFPCHPKKHLCGYLRASPRRWCGAPLPVQLGSGDENAREMILL